MRAQSAEFVASLNPAGIAIGGLSVGEPFDMPNEPAQAGQVGGEVARLRRPQNGRVRGDAEQREDRQCALHAPRAGVIDEDLHGL